MAFTFLINNIVSGCLPLLLIEHLHNYDIALHSPIHIFSAH
jgi:hypothetical protein